LEVFDNLQLSTKIIAFEDRWDFVGHMDKPRYQAVDRAAALAERLKWVTFRSPYQRFSTADFARIDY